MTKNPDVRFAKSIVDYIFRWMAGKFLSPEAKYAAGLNVPEPTSPEQLVLDVKSMAPKTAEDVKAGDPAASHAKKTAFSAIQNQEDAPPCTTCGSIMIRSGACYKCPNCGTTSGCA
jgi:ribonucleoside-diphosphate reductase alpha chain